MPSILFILKLLILKNIKSHIRLWRQIVLELVVIFGTLIIFLNVNRVMAIDTFIRENKENIYYENQMELEKINLDM